MFLRTRRRTRFQIIETHVKSVDAHRSCLILQIGVLEGVHEDYIDFAERISSF